MTTEHATYSVPPFSADRSGPDALVERLRAWGEATEWCDWIELSGSLGRGAGDSWSDLDAGAGVTWQGTSFDDRVDDVLAAVGAFAPVADVEATGRFGDTARHLQIQYADGRQLSLVVMADDARPGLPPESTALVDKSGRLATSWTPSSARIPDTFHRERLFLVWWTLGDVAKHTRRGMTWRAIEALHESRGYLWQLVAADARLVYPAFGAVTVQNAGIEPPPGIEETVPSSAEPTDILRAARRLADVTDAVAPRDDVAGVRAITLAKIDAAITAEIA